MASAEELSSMGPGTCIAIPADMQKLSEVERLVSELSKRESALHVLVNNAGAAWGATIDDYPVRVYSMLSRSSVHVRRSRSKERSTLVPVCDLLRHSESVSRVQHLDREFHNFRNSVRTRGFGARYLNVRLASAGLNTIFDRIKRGRKSSL